MDLSAVLRHAVEKGASDVYFKVGQLPVLRSDGVALGACGTAPCTTKVPVQTLTGAGGRSYRVDTYVTWQSVGSGRLVKLVTVVVRDGTDPMRVWARTASSFDQSTGT